MSNNHHIKNINTTVHYLFGIVCIIVGATIYIIWRSPELLGFRLFEVTGLSSFMHQCRDWGWGLWNPHGTRPSLFADYFLYSLPDALWSLAYILIIDAYICQTKIACTRNSLSSRIIWISICPCIGIISELLQYFHCIPGTFDKYDLISYSVPFFIYIIHNLYFILLLSGKPMNT